MKTSPRSRRGKWSIQCDVLVQLSFVSFRLVLVSFSLGSVSFGCFFVSMGLVQGSFQLVFEKVDLLDFHGHKLRLKNNQTSAPELVNLPKQNLISWRSSTKLSPTALGKILPTIGKSPLCFLKIMIERARFQLFLPEVDLASSENCGGGMVSSGASSVAVSASSFFSFTCSDCRRSVRE